MKIIILLLLTLNLTSCGKKEEASSGVSIKGDWRLQQVNCYASSSSNEADQVYLIGGTTNEVTISFKGRRVIWKANNGECVTNSDGNFIIDKRKGSSGAIIDLE